MPQELVLGTKEEGVSFGQGLLVRPSDMAHKGQVAVGNAQRLGFHQGMRSANVALSHFQPVRENAHVTLRMMALSICARGTPGLKAPVMFDRRASV